MSPSVASPNEVSQISTFIHLTQISKDLQDPNIGGRLATPRPTKDPSLYHRGEAPVHHPPQTTTGVSPYFYKERVLANNAQMGRGGLVR